MLLLKQYIHRGEGARWHTTDYWNPDYGMRARCLFSGPQNYIDRGVEPMTEALQSPPIAYRLRLDLFLLFLS